jgi:transcription termination factor Rho
MAYCLLNPAQRSFFFLVSKLDNPFNKFGKNMSNTSQENLDLNPVENKQQSKSQKMKIRKKIVKNKKDDVPHHAVGIEGSNSEPNHSEQSENIANNKEQFDLQDRSFKVSDFKDMSATDMIELAESLDIEPQNHLNKSNLAYYILKTCASRGAVVYGDGVLEIVNDNYGFLRSSKSNYKSSSDDIYVSPPKIKKLGLRNGDTISGVIKPPRKDEKYFSLATIELINGIRVEENKHRMFFDDLTPLYPKEMLKLEVEKSANKKNLSGRVIDIIAPLGKGQRALIVAPPRTGKTVLMQNIAHSITSNFPDVYLIVLSIGERPEEVTDMIRSVKGEVVSSTFDEPSHRHVSLAELVIEKARRLVESGKDVAILLDSITRLARAYNDIAPSSGRVLSGGVDSNALQRPKKFFGAARNIEEGGSLTIIATSLIETGSRMDEVIFEEFKGTGNAEIVLDRKISDKRVFPAIDITKSGTRKEELLVDQAKLSKSWVLRKLTNSMGTTEAAEFLLSKLKMCDTNEDFFKLMTK